MANEDKVTPTIKRRKHNNKSCEKEETIVLSDDDEMPPLIPWPKNNTKVSSESTSSRNNTKVSSASTSSRNNTKVSSASTSSCNNTKVSSEKEERFVLSDDDDMPPLIPWPKNNKKVSSESTSSRNNTNVSSESTSSCNNTNVSSESTSCNNTNVSSESMSSRKSELVVLSWNIDGLDQREIQLRSLLGVYQVINAHSPDVLLLQEVVDENLTALQQLCCGKYTFLVYKLAAYYNAIMVKKDKRLVCGEMKHVEFKNSGMGRYLCSQVLTINGTSFTMLTTHLESCANASDLRKEQLRICFDTMKNCMTKSNVILSGDLNLRENEIKALGGPPTGISDAWITCGSDTSKKFSWDLQLNDNLSFGNTKPRARYDRMYFSSLKDNGIKCTSFDLVGKERIEACGLFPSDHFGLLVKFTL